MKPVNKLFGLFLIAMMTLGFSAGDKIPVSDAGRPPRIDPELSGIVIPPNIAPLHFRISEPGSRFKAEICGPAGIPIHIQSRGPEIRIPIRRWKAFLKANQGQVFRILIDVRNKSGRWSRFKPVTIRIAPEEIDSHVAYRLINPGYVLWWDMGLYQRNIETFKESAIVTNRSFKHNCMNCHAFSLNDPDRMMFHMRTSYGGTVFIENGRISKVNTGTDKTMSAGVYPSWHPDGNHVAFSVNKISQSFHSAGDKNIYVWDKASDLVVYDVKNKIVTTCPEISTRRLENCPAWSADGKFLYYISADPFDEKMSYDKIRYNLMRISYDAGRNRWGKAELLIDAAKMGKSISWPRPSPDGRLLLFTMSDFGYFSIHFKSSDLYLLDLETLRFQEMEAVNSESSDSYHSWSSNSRWFVFASKRKDGLCSRLYFSYVDPDGRAHKPVLLPQEDPSFYETFIRNYNAPEMIKGPVKVKAGDILREARMDPEAAQFDPEVEFDALSGATWNAGKESPEEKPPSPQSAGRQDR